jgi:ABC-type transport system substrate-binding protein/DNA-binding SARP family transcriptional activator/streptogramin lyase
VNEPLEFRILGPFEAVQHGRVVDLPAGKPRALLALLILRRGVVVSVDTLVDELWGESPPQTAAKNIQGYVARLRRALGDGVVATRAPGYALQLDDDALDAARFQAFLEQARHEEPATASERLGEALALWRGPPLADFAYESFAQDEIRRLEDLRLGALEDRIEADLALGRHEDVLPELEALVASHPLRERLQGQLLVALYRCGRQADALEAYRAARRRLVDELGVEPAPELQALERKILEHDSSLQAPERRARPLVMRSSRRLGRRGLIAAAVAVAALVAALLAVLLPSGSKALSAAPNSIGVLDGKHMRAVITGGGEPGGIAYGAGAVWVTDTAGDRLLRIDPGRRTIDRIPVGHRPTGVAIGGGQVWVVNQLDRNVSEINPRALRQVAAVQVGNGASAIAFGHGSIWVANTTDYSLSRIDPDKAKVIATVPLAGVPGGVASGREGMWVASSSTGQLLLVDPKSNHVSQSVAIGNGPRGVAAGGGSVWVANGPDGSVSRYEPSSGRIRKITVGDAPEGVAYGDGSVWVANSLDGTVSRIDPDNGSARLIRVGNQPTAVAPAGGDAWVTVLPGPTSHRGGTLRIAAGAAMPYSADPTAFGGTTTQWQVLSLTNDGLVTYRRAGGLAGAELVPDLATAIPQPTDGGRTYTFQLRRGIRYSNGDVVRPDDIRRGIQRVLTVTRANEYLASQYTGIVGAQACFGKPTTCDLSRGIEIDRDAGTITFHLTKPDPEFLYKLAFAMASAVPAGTPKGDIGRTPLPATGPYVTKSFTPNTSWVLVRNPRFHEWSHEAQPDGYPDRIEVGVGPPGQVAALERGSTDVLLAPPLGRVDELARRFANQLHIDPVGATFALAMNTRVAPFDNLAVRKALNYALDRNRIARLTGSSLTAQPTCQILAPTIPGYRPYCPYTLDPGPSGSWTAPDLAKAQQLVDSSGTKGMKVALVLSPPLPREPTVQIGRYVVSVLDRLGYEASSKVIDDTSAAGVGALGDSRKRPQVGWFTWYQDHPTPSNFVNPLLTCAAFLPANAYNLNIAEFCDRSIDAEARRAHSLQQTDPAAAGETWGRVDRDLVDQAPWAPLYNPRAVTALGARVGNYQYHPFWTVLLDQLWVR